MRRTLGLLILLLAIGGCSRTSFIGSRFDNFTAYYNKFFNARKAFDAGLKALEQRDTRIDRNRYLPLFTNPDAAASSSNFQDAIKKSADVLREHPRSKWVDDALLLIGKSYFYQRNYIGAEQKFLEVVALDTPLEDEARFWLARTLITGGNLDEAAKYLTESLNRDDVSRRWGPRLKLALGELYVQRGDWENAAKALSEGLAEVHDKDLGARAQFLLGQVYETIGDYELAYEAYSRVERFHPLYELSYAAQLSAVRVLGGHLDEEAALRALRRMERDDKHYQYRNELAYVRGRIYQAQGHPDDAFLVYDHILYEADGDVQSVRGRVHYALAELYRDAYGDYLTAAAHFDTASTALGTATAANRNATAGRSGSEIRYTPEAVTDATEQKETFASFAEVMYRIHEMDSLLYLGSLDQKAFDEAVLEVRRQLAADLEAQRRELERRQANQAFRDAGAAEAARSRTGTSAVSGATAEAGFLYYRDPMLVEEARLNFEAVWGERPLVPNWRRREAVNLYLATANDEGGGVDSVATVLTATDGSLPHVDVSAVPRDSVSQAEMRAERAAASYQLANVLFLSMNEPDSAAVWYRRVIEDANDSTLIQRAYFALAEVQQAIGDQAAAKALYQNVVDISNKTDLGRSVSQRLGLPVAAEVDSDTLAAATRAYDRAYFRWKQGNYRSALSEMIAVAGTYAKTPVAPRALMAAGLIYAEWAREDSLDILGEVPVTVPDSLLSRIGLETRRTRVVPDTAALAVAPVSLDSLSIADSLAVPDSSALPAPAVAEAPEDTTVLAPGLAMLDSLVAAAAQDSLAPPPVADSAAVLVASVPDSSELTRRGQEVAAAVDSIIVEEFEPINLERLYASIATNYASSPFADRARRIREALAETRQERIEADSLARAAADSVVRALDTLALPTIPGLILDSLSTQTATKVDSLDVIGAAGVGMEGVAVDSSAVLSGAPGAASPADSATVEAGTVGSEEESTTVPAADSSAVESEPPRRRFPPRARVGDGAEADTTSEPVY